MARFERSGEGRREPRSSSPNRSGSSSNRDGRDGSSSNRDGRGRLIFESSPRGNRYPDRESKRNSKNRRDFQMTKVTCSSCGSECEVPFKPTTSKPVYCNDCFSKKEKSGSGKTSNKDLEMINEKLNKIMKALEIE